MALASAFRTGRKLKFSVEFAQDAFKVAFDQKKTDLAKVNTDAMRETEIDAKTLARAAVRAGGPGFRKRWPNAVRSQTYPKKGKTALGPAAVVWVRSEYAGVFETGATIGGKPYLWLPLPSVPAYMNRKRIRPGLIRGLIAIKRTPGKAPLLGIRVAGTAARLSGRITTALLNRGTYEGRASKRGQRTKYRVIPLFVGIPSARIGKHWNIRGAVTKAGASLNSRILSRLK
jgi:hypothetical protein